MFCVNISSERCRRHVHFANVDGDTKAVQAVGVDKYHDISVISVSVETNNDRRVVFCA